MVTAIANMWKIKDLRFRILFTLGIIFVYRIGSYVPVPSVNAAVLAKLGDNPIFGLLNTFSGGALQNFSVFAMGITPYITSSIIVQLLQMGVVPKFEEWQKEGESGRRRLIQITRYGTVVLGFSQSVGMSLNFNRLYPGLVVNPGFWTYLLIAITLTTGTAFLMWLGEQITEKGIGNGISILIFAAIVARFENAGRNIYQTWFYQHPDQLFLNIVKVILLLAGIIAVVAGVIFVQQGVRRIPIQYAKRVIGMRTVGGQSTHLPLRVNAAGVIPVIFATSLLLFPVTIASFFQQKHWAQVVMSYLNYTSVTYLVVEFFLIIAFTYFYTYVQINPEQLTEQLQKNNGFIPGIRPGKPTEEYIVRVMNRITLAGSVFLAVVAIIPAIFGHLTHLNVYFGGTSLLIVVGVALETMKQIESQMLQRHYKGFIR